MFSLVLKLQILVTIVLVQRRFLNEFMLSASASSLGILFHMLITLTEKLSLLKFVFTCAMNE